MIWQVSFSQKTTLWILAAAFVIGGGINIVRSLSPERAEFPVSVTASESDQASFKSLADSIMHLRLVATDAPIDINVATAAQFEKLSGIGPVLAANIVKYRDQHGSFRTVDDLDKVNGIGPKRLESIRERCVANPPNKILLPE
jgi:competence ComEA-like helix-hairpin-helix protein